MTAEEAIKRITEGYQFDPDRDRDVICQVYEKDTRGMTVAHWMVMQMQGHRLNPVRHENILRLADKTGWTVAHEMASQSDLYFDLYSALCRHRDILMLADADGQTVAHVMTAGRCFFYPDRDREILKLSDKKGWTVAHSVVFFSRVMFNPVRNRDLLRTADKRGETVAHWMVSAGYFFDPLRDRDILLLADKYGWTVAEVQGVSKEEIEKLKAGGCAPGVGR